MVSKLKAYLYKLFIVLLLFSCRHKNSTKNIDNQINACNPKQNTSVNENFLFAQALTLDTTRIFIRGMLLPPYRTDTTSQKILLIGDSMSKWLRYRLQDYCQENGHTLSTVTWVSGNTEWFAKYDTLDYYIKKDSISYVFLVLGANELFIKDFATHRATFVDTILKKLKNIKWIWVGPPNWKNDKGINDCLLEKLGQEKFFLSKNLSFKRQKDGMHPTVASCSMWVDSVVSWITHVSTSRIKLNVPDSSYQLKPDAILLKPLE